MGDRDQRGVLWFRASGKQWSDALVYHQHGSGRCMVGICIFEDSKSLAGDGAALLMELDHGLCIWVTGERLYYVRRTVAVERSARFAGVDLGRQLRTRGRRRRNAGSCRFYFCAVQGGNIYAE